MINFRKNKPADIWEQFPILENIPKERFPKHVFIIPDGNGRWAKKRRLPVYMGHQKGYETTVKLLRELKNLPIDIITLWGFSADNWKRPEEEKNALMKIFDKGIRERFGELLQEHGRFIHIGRRDRIPKELKKLFEETEEETKNNKGQIVCVAIDFGGEDQEKRIVDKARNLPENKEITDDVLWSLRDSGGIIKHADLIIRTGGVKHISDVGWLHGAPTELHFIDKFFPDTTIEDIVLAIVEFSKQERRMGGRTS